MPETHSELKTIINQIDIISNGSGMAFAAAYSERK
jgi:hypothetical protein